ncbi:MAG: sterol desaturase family protein [Sandaracinaceae bacterium]|nr:sterol desaturase family protein [Myxococcales bacterium]MCB9656457.1 sterol desaturase family protein [Sandaracinaceae bacterium]
MNPFAAVLIALCAGALTWSFLEYCIHRWLGHDRRLRGNLFGQEHTRHHSEGDYFAPTYKKLLAALAALLVVLPPSVLVAGPLLGASYAGGLVAFYLYYEVLHRREHTHAGIGPYGRWARRHHFYHHFVDPSVNHGVTSPLWDVVFGTYRAPGVIPVPAKLQMRWLADPSTGDVRAPYAAFYTLRGRAARSA